MSCRKNTEVMPHGRPNTPLEQPEARDVGLCPWCNNSHQQIKSHAIPDAFFKAITRKNSGYLKVIDGAGTARNSIDTGKAFLLCGHCDSEFNKRWDAIFINRTNEYVERLNTNAFDHRMFIDNRLAAEFLLSVLWRASLSASEFYRGFTLYPKMNHMLELCIRGTENPFNLATFRLQVLSDPTHEMDYGGLIFPPKIVQVPLSDASYFMVIMVMNGILCRVFLPKTPSRFRRFPGILIDGRKHVVVPTVNMFEDSDIGIHLLRAYAKANGLAWKEYATP